MLESFIDLPCYLIFLWFAAKRLITYLHIFQQEEYDNERFLQWILDNRAFDKRLSAGLLVLWLLSFIIWSWLTILLTAAAFGAAAYVEKDPQKSAKKPLNLTQRAKRILIPAFLIAALAGFSLHSPLAWLFLVQFMPLFLVGTNVALVPYEKKTQQKFYDEAVEKLGLIRPKIVAVTGSFGKTSVKHILGHILKTAAQTLITPGSVNTVMGITRIIREQLEPHHKFFIVEMGAYGPGSITKLCALTPPNFGIISAIGHAHYERFKTLETVAEAKYELAQSVLGKKGKMIVHEQTLRFPYTQTMKNKNTENFITCGEALDNNLQIKTISQNEKGLTVNIIWMGTPYTLQAPLYGLHHGHNMALAFAAAVTIGMTPEDVIAALSTTPQISHRLELKPQGDGSFIIDDAYNSNPQGFESALELLATLKSTGRGILITPGMVELGDAHEEEHRRLGAIAAEKCDIVIAISPNRIPSFIAGFKGANGKELLEFETFMQAQDWIVRNKKSGDYILLENDLPDLYERIPQI